MAHRASSLTLVGGLLLFVAGCNSSTASGSNALDNHSSGRDAGRDSGGAHSITAQGDAAVPPTPRGDDDADDPATNDAGHGETQGDDDSAGGEGGDDAEVDGGPTKPPVANAPDASVGGAEERDAGSATPASGADGGPADAGDDVATGEDAGSGGGAGGASSSGGAGATAGGNGGSGQASAGAAGAGHPVCTLVELLQTNGSFDEAGGWSIFSSGGGDELVNLGDDAQSPPIALLLGGYANANDILRQTVTIPEGGSNLVISLWVRIETEEPSSYEVHDQFYASLMRDNLVFTGVQLSNVYRFSEWTHLSVAFQSEPSPDEPKLVPGTYDVLLSANGDATNPTSFYVDTVSLTARVCQ